MKITIRIERRAERDADADNENLFRDRVEELLDNIAEALAEISRSLLDISEDSRRRELLS